MFQFSVTADGPNVLLVLDDYTGNPQTWIIPRHGALQMAEMLSAAAQPAQEKA